MPFYVRTAAGGTAPDTLIPDIGYVITSGSWQNILRSEVDDGYFTSIELKYSDDLADLISADTVEWSLDAGAPLAAAYFNPDQIFVSDIVSATFNLSGGGRIILPSTNDPGSMPSPAEGEIVFSDGYFLGYNGTAFNPLGESNPDDLVFTEVNLASGQKIYGVGNELAFSDSSGIATLTTLKSMRSIWADGYGYGNFEIYDDINWAAEYAFLSTILVATESTNWNMWICEQADYSDGLQVVRHGLGTTLVDINREYFSFNQKVRIIYESLDGYVSSAYFNISGEARRH